MVLLSKTGNVNLYYQVGNTIDAYTSVVMLNNEAVNLSDYTKADLIIYESENSNELLRFSNTGSSYTIDISLLNEGKIILDSVVLPLSANHHYYKLVLSNSESTNVLLAGKFIVGNNGATFFDDWQSDTNYYVSEVHTALPIVEYDFLAYSASTLSNINSRVSFDLFYPYTGLTESRLTVLESLTGGSSNVLAVNGLTKSGNNIRLGGTLTGNTTISGGGFTLNLGAFGSSLSSLSTRSSGANILVAGNGNSTFTLTTNTSLATTGSITLTPATTLNLNPTGFIQLNGANPSSPTTQFLRGDKTWAVPTFTGGTENIIAKITGSTVINAYYNNALIETQGNVTLTLSPEFTGKIHLVNISGTTIVEADNLQTKNDYKTLSEPFASATLYYSPVDNIHRGFGDFVAGYLWDSIALPTWTPNITLNYSGSGGVDSGDVGSNRLIAVDGLWDRMVVSGLKGSAGNEYKFMNADADVRIGNIAGAYANNKAITTNNSGANHIELWGKSLTQPLVIRDNNGGVFVDAITGDGTTFKVFNIIATGLTWATLWGNTADLTKKYKLFEFDSVRNQGSISDGEALTYLGSTDKDVFSMFENIVGRNSVAMDRASEGIQINNCENLQLERLTIHNVGRYNPPVGGQMNLLQAQNTTGILKDSVLDGAPRGVVQCGHGFISFNNYWYWEVNPWQMQNLGSEYELAENTVMNNRLPIFIIDNDIEIATGSTWLQINDPNVDYVLINNRLGTGITSIYSDGRGSSDNVIRLIGNTSGNTIPKAQYQSKNILDTNFGKVIDSYNYTTHRRGAYTHPSRQKSLPTYNIISYSVNDSVEADEGTPFSGVTLPQVVSVTVSGVTGSSGQVGSFVINLPITWSAGTYDPDVQDVYTITGSTSLPDWYIVKNPNDLYASIDVEVVEPDLSFNPYNEVDLVAGFNPTNYNGSTWTNSGSAANADQSIAVALPTSVTGLTRTGFGVNFIKANSEGLGYGTGTVTTPFETWIEFITPSSFTGFATGTLLSNGSTPRIDINISGTANLRLNGTTAGITLNTSTRYVIRIVSSGASSTITVNNGSPVNYALGSSSSGSSTPKIGMAYSAGSYFNGIIGDILQFENVKDSTFVTNMWTWFGM